MIPCRPDQLYPVSTHTGGDAVAALAQMLGSVAVLITLVYLAVQVRYAKDALRLSSRQAASTHQTAMFSMANEIHHSILENESHASLLTKLKGDEPLTAIEQEWRQAHVYCMMNLWQAIQNAHDLDLLPAGLFETMCADVEANLTLYPSMREQARSVLISYPNVDEIPIFKPILAPARAG